MSGCISTSSKKDKAFVTKIVYEMMLNQIFSESQLLTLKKQTMKRVEAKLDDKTYKRFAKYCKDNGLFINAAIRNLIINATKTK